MNLARFKMSRRRQIGAGAAALLLSVGCVFALWDRSSNEDVLRIAYSYSDGGGVCSLSDTGVPEDIVFEGIRIVRASKGGTYCCGYTFAVAMKAAQERGLLDGKQPYEISRFQREWYGSMPGSAEKQAVLAAVKLGIGREVPPPQARAGDFVVFQPPIARSAHPVIFLDWVRHEGVIIGVEYRGSQASTDGIADNKEYFTTSGYAHGMVDPERFYVVRLNGR